MFVKLAKSPVCQGRHNDSAFWTQFLHCDDNIGQITYKSMLQRTLQPYEWVMLLRDILQPARMCCAESCNFLARTWGAHDETVPSTARCSFESEHLFLFFFAFSFFFFFFLFSFFASNQKRPVYKIKETGFFETSICCLSTMSLRRSTNAHKRFVDGVQNVYVVVEATE